MSEIGTIPPPPLRAWVFIDGQNVYNDARRAFHDPDTDPAWCGQISSLQFGRLLVQFGNENDPERPRTLEKVNIYKGRPSEKHQRQAYGAFRRQEAALKAEDPNIVEVIARTLRYPDDWPKSKAEEKGIDVALAVDLLYHAYRRDYDVAVVASTDTDLVPALEALCDLRRAWGRPRLEVVSWLNPKTKKQKRLRVDGQSLWCHWPDGAAYAAVQDRTDYNVPKPSRS